jgi:hypothetical protein
MASMTRLFHNFPQLKQLKKVSAKKRNQILSKAQPDLINTLCDCCLNIINGNLKINPTQKKKLLKFAPVIRSLAKKRKSVQKRKEEIISQTGGFLPALLAPVLSIAASTLLGSLMNNG